MKKYLKPEIKFFDSQIDTYCTSATISYEVENPGEGGSAGAVGGLQEGSVKDDL